MARVRNRVTIYLKIEWDKAYDIFNIDRKLLKDAKTGKNIVFI